MFVVCSILVSFAYLLNLDELGRHSALDLDDFSIDNLTDEQIITETKSQEILSSTKYQNNTSSGASSISSLDSDKIQFSCKKINGISKVSVTKAKDCNLILTISSELLSGRAKIVVIRDDLILDYVDFNESVELTYSVTGEHIFTIKILCEEAELTIAVSRTFD